MTPKTHNVLPVHKCSDVLNQDGQGAAQLPSSEPHALPLQQGGPCSARLPGKALAATTCLQALASPYASQAHGGGQAHYAGQAQSGGQPQGAGQAQPPPFPSQAQGAGTGAQACPTDHSLPLRAGLTAPAQASPALAQGAQAMGASIPAQAPELQAQGVGGVGSSPGHAPKVLAQGVGGAGVGCSPAHAPLGGVGGGGSPVRVHEVQLPGCRAWGLAASSCGGLVAALVEQQEQPACCGAGSQDALQVGNCTYCVLLRALFE